MDNSRSFFQPAQNILGGYYIKVRNVWNYYFKLRHLTEKQKELYEKEFDHKILMDHEFLDWYERIRKEQNN
jgi:hypothetical protein